MRQLKITKSITNRESASLDKYLQEIGREDLITVEEEVELAQAIKRGDRRALEKLTRANLRFVVSVAKQYQNQGLSLPDLINEGNLGLIKAAEKFDETRGFKFISYAVWWIRQSILQALAEQSRIVRLPLNQVGSLNKISKAFSKFEQENERRPSPEELADELDIPVDKISDTLKVSGRHISVDAPFVEGEDVFREDEEDEAEENDDKEDIPEQPVFKKKTRSKAKEVHLNVPEYDREKEEGPLSMDLVQNDQNSEIKDFIMKALNKSDKAEADNQQTVSARKIETPQVEKPEVQETMTEDGEKSFSNEINKANLSLKELIANAKQKLENNYDKINKEDEAEQRREAEARINEKAKNIDINVPVPDYSLYDTKNLQEELAANMSDLFKADEEDEDVKTFVPASKHQDEKQEEKEPVKENATAVSVNTDIADEAENTETSDDDDQIEGQMDITEWMQSVREEKYGKQDTREFSKSELERYLDEKEEKSAAYEKMVERKKAEALAAGNEIDKEEAKQVALAQMAVDSARMDLAIRTGKAAARLEQEAAKAAAAVTKKAPVNAEEPSEEIPLVTAQIPTVSESMISDINSIMNDDNNKEEGDEAVAQQEAAAGVEPEETVPFTRQNRQPESMEEYNTDNDEVEEEKDKKLTGELAKIFRKYRDMPGLEEQLVDLFDTIDDEMQINTSKVGNILISGNSSSDKTDLARTIIRAINTLYPDKQKKIAKTSGESINQRGIAKAMGRLKGTALIVEGAGTIQPKRINELLNCLEQDTDRMIVIFEDSDTDMNVLINFNPELTNTFNHRIILKQYTVNELVEMAKRFARKRQYEVDDDALLELYLKIDKLHNVNDNIKLDDIKEIINQAIVNSERRASRRFFGGLKKKRSENGDVIFLTEADFKDR